MSTAQTIPTPTGKRFSSVKEMLSASVDTKDLIPNVEQGLLSSSVTRYLTSLRLEAGLTQAKMGERLGLSQSQVSKIESGSDEELSLETLKAYATALDKPLMFYVGKRMNHVECVNFHAAGIKRHLNELASLANKDEELHPEIEKFFGDAVFKIMGILAECSDNLRPAEISEGVRIYMPHLQSYFRSKLNKAIAEESSLESPVPVTRVHSRSTRSSSTCHA